jgi:hypothetical protein
VVKHPCLTTSAEGPGRISAWRRGYPERSLPGKPKVVEGEHRKQELEFRICRSERERNNPDLGR